ncbi:hypothetical protein P4S70_01240 [Enterovibrio sp. Hal110]
MAIAVNITGDAELQRLQQHIARLSDAGNRRQLLALIGAEAETQTHRRIRDEKPRPMVRPGKAGQTAMPRPVTVITHY